jgi:uncharacterized protein affecting Mg2+/Co2+ transport
MLVGAIAALATHRFLSFDRWLQWRGKQQSRRAKREPSSGAQLWRDSEALAAMMDGSQSRLAEIRARLGRAATRQNGAAAAAPNVLHPTPRPPLPLAPAPPPMPWHPDVQPDALRLASPPQPGELRCDEAIGPESFSRVVAGDSELTIFAHSKFLEHDAAYKWEYRVEITNVGKTHVQLLTRHWVFVDADGLVDEIKGAGAGGQMPVLMPGVSWAYMSHVSLGTPRGSIRGSFQFETLVPTSHEVVALLDAEGFGPEADAEGGVAAAAAPDARDHAQVFSGTVGRLALSDGDSGEMVLPCGAEARPGAAGAPGGGVGSGGDSLPLTSVWITARLVLGAVVQSRSQLT